MNALSIFMVLSLAILSIQAYSSLQNENAFNRMACENETLQLSCEQINGQIQIERAYYGRYSITPCNKEHRPFRKGCTAENALDLIKWRCNFQSSCEIEANRETFGVPCPDTVHILEVIYTCIPRLTEAKADPIEKVDQTISVFSEDKEAWTINEEAVRLEEETIEPSHTDWIPLFYTTRPIPLSLIERIDVEKEIRPECKYDDVVSVGLYEFVKLPCTLMSAQANGYNLYQCLPNKTFKFVNSTCELSTSARKLDLAELEQDLEHSLQERTVIELVDIVRNLSFIQNEYALDRNMARVVLDSVSQAIDHQEKWTSLREEERVCAATKLLHSVDDVLFQAADRFKRISALTPEQLSNYLSSPFVDVEDNIVAEVSSNKDMLSTVRLPSDPSLEFSSESAVIPIREASVDQMFLFAVFKNMGQMFYRQSSDTRGQVVSLDSIRRVRSHSKNGTREKSQYLGRIINSNLVSIKVNDQSTRIDLTHQPISITFRHLRTQSEIGQGLAGEPVCAFLVYQTTDFKPNWSTDGCALSFSNLTHSVCECTHLTHFALLMDVYGVQEQMDEKHRLALTIITIVCSSISCVSILLTLLGFQSLKKLRKRRDISATSDLTIITSHLCACLFLSLVFFLTGIVLSSLQVEVACSVIATVSHFFFLCTFFWMLMEGVQLYIMLVYIFALESSPILKFSIISYGGPLLIVLGAKLYDLFALDSTGYGTQNACWLSSQNHFNLFFIVPVSLILVANLVIVLIVLKSMRESYRSNIKTNRKNERFNKSLFAFWCLVLNLLGLPWLLGFLITDEDSSIAFAYLFTVINSSQGTIIFLFQCVVPKAVRNEMFKSLKSSLGRASQSHSSGQRRSNDDERRIQAAKASKPWRSLIARLVRRMQIVDTPHSSTMGSGQSSSTASSCDDSCGKYNPSTHSTAKNLLLKHCSFSDADYKSPRLILNAQPVYFESRQVPLVNNNYIGATIHSQSFYSNNQTRSSYISPIASLNRFRLDSQSPFVAAPLPPPPPLIRASLRKSAVVMNPPYNYGPVCFSTFKSISRRASNYDENQYLTPESNGYSVIDGELKAITNYERQSNQEQANNYVELMEELGAETSGPISQETRAKANCLSMTPLLRNCNQPRFVSPPPLQPIDQFVGVDDDDDEDDYNEPVGESLTDQNLFFANQRRQDAGHALSISPDENSRAKCILRQK
nr:G protein-coupled receptor [Proales similis]